MPSTEIRDLFSSSKSPKVVVILHQSRIVGKSEAGSSTNNSVLHHDYSEVKSVLIQEGRVDVKMLWNINDQKTLDVMENEKRTVSGYDEWKRRGASQSRSRHRNPCRPSLI